MNDRRVWRTTVASGLFLLAGFASVRVCRADELQVPSQPLLAQVHRLTEALDVVGRPLNSEALERIAAAKQLASDAEVVNAVQQVLDPLCLATVEVQQTGPSRVSAGTAKPELLEQGWRVFLIKVINRHGRTGRLFVESPNARKHIVASGIISNRNSSLNIQNFSQIKQKVEISILQVRSFMFISFQVLFEI